MRRAIYTFATAAIATALWACETPAPSPSDDDATSKDDTAGAKKKAKKKKKGKKTSATASASERPETPPPPPPPPTPPPPVETSLASLFDGAPSSDVKLTLKGAPGGTMKAGVPEGWHSGSGGYEGMLWMQSPDAMARICLHHVGPGAVSTQNIEFWAPKCTTTGTRIAWKHDLVDGRHGAEHQAVRLALEAATVSKEYGSAEKNDADLWQLRLLTQPKKVGVMILASLRKDAPAERKRELIAAIQSAR